jgi:hypothetical protein
MSFFFGFYLLVDTRSFGGCGIPRDFFSFFLSFGSNVLMQMVIQKYNGSSVISTPQLLRALAV